MRTALLLAVCLVSPGLTVADDKKDPSKTNLPVDVKLVLKKNVYKMDLDGKELKKLLEAAKDSGRYPPPPAIEGELEIRNRTDKEVSIWYKGDPVVILLALKGPGVVTHKPMLAFTADFRGPEAMKLAPGKSYSLPLKALVGGFRAASEYTYWTEPGEYTLSATLKTGISPAPEGLKKDENGFAEVPIMSDAVKIKIEGK